MRFLTAVLILIFGLNFTASAQSNWFQGESKKGQLSIYWGYNRALFTNSNIRFKGSDYDFTLKSVKALDRQTDFAYDPYFKVNTFTIPQYNFRASYYFKDKWALSFGIDHMKYVMIQDQDVQIEGVIYEETSIYQGEFNGETIKLTDEFLTFEHTDGLNYIDLEVHYFDNLYRFNEKFSINYYGGGGAGMMMPKSNVKLMGFERNDWFHVAGFGMSAKAGLNVTVWKHFFVQTDMTFGYINMFDILTRPQFSADRASQDFFFSMWSFGVGGFIPLSKNKQK